MTRFRLLELADRCAHFLYEPAAHGKRCIAVRHEWAHRIHLIPESWLARMCDRYDEAFDRG